MKNNSKVNTFIKTNVDQQKQALLDELGISRIYQDEDTENNQTYPYYDSKRTQFYRLENIDITDEEYNTLLSIQKQNKELNNKRIKKSNYSNWAIAFIVLTIVVVFGLCLTNKSNLWLWLGIGINDIFLVGLPLLVLSKIEENTRL